MPVTKKTETATTQAEDLPGFPVADDPTPESGTVTVDTSVLEALQKQIADLQAAQAANQAATPPAAPSHVEDIVPEKEDEAEQTYIAHTVHTKDENGVMVPKTFRMKTEDFNTISRQRGW